MFDIGVTELLLIAIVAILVIGPKDMPLALRTAGRWIGKVRRVSGHFKAGVDSMIREAELEEMDQKWREQNEAIMAAHPPEQSSEQSGDQMQPLDSKEKAGDIATESRAEPQKLLPDAADEAVPAKNDLKPKAAAAENDRAEPGLPLGGSEKQG